MTHRTLGAEHPDDRPGVHVLETRDAAGGEPLMQMLMCPMVRADPRVVADQEARDRDPPALDVLLGHPVVADLGRGHHEDLPRVTRVGQRFLIAAEGGVEHHLAAARNRGAEASAFEDRAVLQRETNAAGPVTGLREHVVATVHGHERGI
jgi:hypothetical protein